MKIVSGGPTVSGVTATKEVARTEATSRGAAIASTAGAPSLQSSVLEPALAALNELPEIDHAKVAALRDALAKGELPFNAGKLAALIESYHRSGK
jgi:negative regulator of flagellin synthesis FlgM